MDDLAVVFRTQSQSEADVVRGLLEANGVSALISSRLSRTPFPLSVGELEVRVANDDAEHARRIIDSHRVETDRVTGPFGTEFQPLEERIGYRFRDRGLLEHALTHRSRVHEDASGGVFDNESMEFLGDSVLGFVIADMLFREFPQHNEGQKSKLKASIVSAASLARLAERLGLGEFLILGRGEEKTGGRRKHAILADCYEALIAAIYLDGGTLPVQGFIRRQFRDLIEEARRAGVDSAFTEDYKSELQEWLQREGRGLPLYRLVAEIGPPHRRRFSVEIVVDDEVIASSEGRSKKEAAQGAARAALARLKSES